MFGHFLAWLGLAPRRPDMARVWYDQIMAKAREPEPYRAGWAQDTLDGRFGMASLVSILVLRRLRDAGPGGPALADRVYREVFEGFDYALREEGVGDSSIARKMRKRGEAYFGLARAVDAAFADDTDDTLADVLRRNDVAVSGYEDRLAAWAFAIDSDLAAIPAERLMQGEVDWRDAT